MIMKKIILCLFLILLSPSISLATSGACSWHGGVDCSLSNSTQSIICSDGWLDSSTSYENLSECRNVQCNVDSVKYYVGHKGMTGSASGSALIQRCEELNKNTSNSSGYSDYVDVAPISTDNLLKAKMQEFCVENYGVNSFNDWNNKKCECNAGYIKNSNNNFRCEKEEIVKKSQDEYVQQKMQKYCTNKYGDNSIYTSGTCACNKGFSFNDSNICVPTKETPQGKFDIAFDELFYKTLKENPSFPKDLDKELIKKIALTPEYINISLVDVIKKYLSDNKLDSLQVPVKETEVPFFSRFVNPIKKTQDIKKTENKVKEKVTPISSNSSNTTPYYKTEIAPELSSNNFLNSSQPIKLNINKENKEEAENKTEPVKKIRWYHRIFNWFK